VCSPGFATVKIPIPAERIPEGLLKRVYMHFCTSFDCEWTEWDERALLKKPFFALKHYKSMQYNATAYTLFRARANGRNQTEFMGYCSLYHQANELREKRWKRLVANDYTIRMGTLREQMEDGSYCLQSYE